MPNRAGWISVLLLLQALLSWAMTLARLSQRRLVVALISTVLMAISAALTLLQARDSRRAHRGAVRRILSRRLQGLASHLHATAPRERIRINVMLVDKRAQVLRVFAHTGLAHAEAQLVWAKGQGICGVAWQEEEQRIAPAVSKREFEAQRSKNHSTPWNMTEQQCDATQELGAVASLPLRTTAGDDEVIGVLNFDSLAPPAESILAEVVSSALYRALDLEDLLTTATTNGTLLQG